MYSGMYTVIFVMIIIVYSEKLICFPVVFELCSIDKNKLEEFVNDLLTYSACKTHIKFIADVKGQSV